MPQPILVRKLNYDGTENFRWTGEVVEDDRRHGGVPGADRGSLRPARNEACRAAFAGDGGLAHLNARPQRKRDRLEPAA